MNAYRCDRCGLYYTKNKISAPGHKTSTIVDGVELTVHSGSGQHCTDSANAMDLCDGCVEKLLDFLSPTTSEVN